MPKKSTVEKQPSETALNLTVGHIEDIPKVVRAGRTSRYAPLYARLKQGLKADEMISLPITKYSQVQAFREKVDALGYAVSVRKVDTGLVAYIKHKTEEKSE